MKKTSHPHRGCACCDSHALAHPHCPFGTRPDVDVSGTGGWQNWEEVSCEISGAEGEHDLYFKYTGGSG